MVNLNSHKWFFKKFHIVDKQFFLGDVGQGMTGGIVVKSNRQGRVSQLQRFEIIVVVP